jgi:hypothetical protein
MSENVLSSLAQARNLYFQHRRSNDTDTLFLEGEARILNMLEQYSLNAALMRIISMPLPGVAAPAPVAPTANQLNAGLIPNDNNTIVAGACAICQDPLGGHEGTARLRNCGHMFHRNCANAWYVRSVFCPLCRNDIRAAPPAQ